MNAERLNEFVVLSKHANLTSAARELFISTSSLSQHITALEQELGYQLFNRAGGMSLTPEGENALEYAQRALFEIDRMRRITIARTGHPFEMRVPNYTFDIQKHLLVARREFMRGHPDARPNIITTEHQMSDPFEILDNGSNDFSGVYIANGPTDTPESIIPPRFEYLHAQHDDLYVVMSRRNRLAAKDVLDLDDFDGQTFLISLCPVSSILLEGIKRNFAARGVNVNVMYRRCNRHIDMLMRDLDDYIVAWGSRAEDMQFPPDIELVTKRTSFDFSDEAYILWRPDKLNDLQLAYIETLRRIMQDATKSPTGDDLG